MTATRPAASETPAPASGPDVNNDLGFGAVVARESRRRLLNRDGSFNVHRVGLGYLRSQSVYHDALTMPWPKFLTATCAVYIAINLLFALAYLACGDGALDGVRDHTLLGRFASAFFFSVDTLATIGYGNVTPVSLAANLIMTAESIVYLLGFALAAGLVFARVSRPTAAIIFSDTAIIAPYHGATALEFRIANARSNELVEVHAKVLLNRRRAGSLDREFIELPLERESVAFFPLSWTIVHPIDVSSPLAGETEESLRESEAELLILLTGTDETFSQIVHTRSSYKYDEVVFGARFSNIFRPTTPDDDRLSIDISKLHEIERVTL